MTCDCPPGVCEVCRKLTEVIEIVSEMPIVQHRAVTPDGKVIEIVTLEAGAQWMPIWPLNYGEPTFETRILPDGEWEPSAIVRKPGKPPKIVTWGVF